MQDGVLGGLLGHRDVLDKFGQFRLPLEPEMTHLLLAWTSSGLDDQVSLSVSCIMKLSMCSSPEGPLPMASGVDGLAPASEPRAGTDHGGAGTGCQYGRG